MNKYEFVPMKSQDADEIKEWRYDGYLESILMDPYYKNIHPETGIMRGPNGCDGYAVYSGDELIGLFEYYHKEGGIIEIGLALNPKYVGKGLSKDFILAGINFAIKKYDYRRDFMQLTVDIKNENAYHAYLKAGFKEISRDKEEVFMKYFLK